MRIKNFYFNTNKTPYFISLKPGSYLLELWGADGASVDPSTSSKGGYSAGYLKLNKTKNIYVFVGEVGQKAKGNAQRSSNAFNGGGSCLTYTIENAECSGGGGASDFRIESKELSKRVLIAGGAGGNGYSYTKNVASNGGFGGGLVAGDAYEGYNGGTKGKGANQTSPGMSYFKGNFGFGGNGTDAGGGCGGGGGLFGGGAGLAYGSGGGGGSGFALTKENFEEATQIGIALSKNDILFLAKVIAGDKLTDEYQKPKMITNGDGFARITFLSFSTCIVKYHNRYMSSIIIIVMIS